MKRHFVLFFLIFSSIYVHAQNSVVGVWKTIDDKTGKVKSHMEIYKKGDKYYGKVLKVIDSEAPQNPICQNCEGKFKDQPIIGLEIMWGLEKDGDEYENGTILDPEKGKTYKCKIWLDENDPNKLNVRGYVLFLYRTQIWERLNS
ncbi:hypothetical protein BST97_06820 [Nonlabens spongiae]|uniref:DUF2147 domain-containing protein n=1 Tax=Nonlabens spongiae TaxID=331648 RepID=A0A1W6MJI1_9FLAO|nr:DUF2147 domain-containing protein [Nonlabens spongiae]ARN77732.1 hypothetical protein BST97_06820 [Nonlabens spongiae]